MTRIIGRLADRLMSVVVPRTTATAGYETECHSCFLGGGGTDSLWTRYCAGSCSKWYIGKCGTC
ncbi:hypothetical protein AB0M46_02290 [Dactylosporangium sp. NPDC051485]|uniref:hypothetical protein n=1 Tax=Dactylosporangium sp. NPDC051485 TaxID=3154846 RepID=UPI0034325D27